MPDEYSNEVRQILAMTDVDVLQRELIKAAAERDALASVVANLWEAIDGLGIIDSGDAIEWMTEVGLIREQSATPEEVEYSDELEEGDSYFILSDLGREALKGTGA